jgi:hypothetical protein
MPHQTVPQASSALGSTRSILRSPSCSSSSCGQGMPCSRRARPLGLTNQTLTPECTCDAQVAALHVLMSFVKRGPSAGCVDKSLMAHVVRHAVCNKHLRGSLLECFMDKCVALPLFPLNLTLGPPPFRYLSQYDDVLMLALNGVRHVLCAHGDGPAPDSEDSDEEVPATPSMPALPQIIGMPWV